MKNWMCYLSVAITIVLSGCFGGAPKYEGDLISAGGMVKVNGQAEANIKVSFIPVGTTQGTGAEGTTDEQGKFTLKHRTGDPGIEAGKYKVVFSKFAKPDGSPVPPEEDAAIAGKEHLPSKYSLLERTKVTAEVPLSGKEDFLFELKFKKK